MMSGLVPKISPALGTTLIISVGYIDLGKWAAAIDGGAHFGPELSLMLVFFSCSAVLCEYLASCIGIVTRKNLAQICSEEYCRLTCVFLGVVAELSMIVSDLTTILGVAHGFNLLFGLDMISCIILASIISVLTPSFSTVVEFYKLEVLYISISGFTLFFYVLGILISHPEISSIKHGKHSTLNLETACSVMALLGANIMPHNFYIHSSIVQQSRRLPNISIGALIHDHYISILFSFTGIFLVNYVLMSSSATIFDNAGFLMPSFEEAFFLMDQIFRSPVAPFPFFVLFFLSSMITALTQNCGGQVVLHDFFGIDMPVWVHHVIVKAIAIIAALYCIQSVGTEGIYHLLLYCQVILAMLLPSSVIPLFRVSSSRWIMGAFKISWNLEIFALVAFLGVLASNVVFTLEMLFGNSSWVLDLRGNMGIGMTLSYTLLLLLSFTSLGFTLYLAVTPLRSASDGDDIQVSTLELQRDLIEQSDRREEIDSAMIIYKKDHDDAAEIIREEFLDCQSDNLIMEPNFDLPERIIGSSLGGHKFSLYSTCTMGFSSQPFCPEEADPVVGMELMQTLSDSIVSERDGSKGSNENDVGMEANVCREKDDEHNSASQPLISCCTSSTSKVRGTSNKARVKGEKTSNIGGKVGSSALSTSGRRQLTSILDEFWGHMFDLHGKLTEEAKDKRVDILLGLDIETASMSVTEEITTDGYFRKSSVDPTTSRDYSKPMQQPIADSPYVIHLTAPSLSPNTQVPDAQFVNQCDGPDCHMIYGFETSPNDRMTSAVRKLLDQLQSPKFAESSGINYGDQVKFTLGQNGYDSPSTSGVQNREYGSSRLHFDRPINRPSLARNISSSAYMNKYCSSPDVSEVNISSCYSSLNDTIPQCKDPLCSCQSLNKKMHEQSAYPNQSTRTEGVRFAFDGHSPSEHIEVVFPEPFSLNLDSKSLWAKQTYEQTFTMVKARVGGGSGGTNKSGASKKIFTYAESEAMILWSFRLCIAKLLKLDGSGWLFTQNGGCDEELIDRIAATERLLHNKGFSKVERFDMSKEEHLTIFPRMCYCGDDCIWQTSLILSFGVWCIHRIIELLIMEKKPELWGKYTYVLNRLQGILDPAFCKPRSPLIPCKCLALQEAPGNGFQENKGSLGGGNYYYTSASLILENIKNVEAAMPGLRGWTSNAAGDNAFRKGKENVGSVLKRYKRRLSSMSSIIIPGDSENGH